MSRPGVRAAMVVGLAAVALAPATAVVTACTCSAADCLTAGGVVLNLSCGPTDLSSVTLSGACASDAGTAPSKYLVGPEANFVGFDSDSSGSCHVELVFANGFTYATDLEFVAKNQGCGCPSYIAPTQGTFQVDNPSSTCLGDGGTE